MSGLSKPAQSTVQVPKAVPPDDGRQSGPSACNNTGCSPIDFTLQSIDGKTVNLKSLIGKTVIVEFIHTYCSNCLFQTRFIQEIYDIWPKDNLIILTIVSQENKENVEQWVDLYRMNPIVLLDVDGKVLNAYSAPTTPTTFFIARSGIIADKKEGPFTSTAEIDSVLRNIWSK